MERFNLIFRGQVRPPLTPDTMSAALAQLGFTTEHIARVRSGRILTVKRNLALSNAQAAQQRLARHGLITELTVTLTADDLAAGLKRINNAETDNISALQIFQPTLVNPSLISPMGTYPVIQRCGSEDGHQSHTSLGAVTQSAPRMTAHARLFLALLLALPLQHYLLRVIPDLPISLPVSSTVMGIICLMVLVIVLPQLIRPLTLRTIQSNDGASTIHLIDQWRWHLNKNTFSALDHRLQLIARIQVKKQSVRAFAPSGQLLYQWDAHQKIEAAENAVSLVTDKVFEDTAYESVAAYWSHLKKIFYFLRPSPKIERIRFTQKHAHLVTNAQGQIIAIIYRNHISVGLSHYENRHADVQILRAMAIVFNDGPLML